MAPWLAIAVAVQSVAAGDPRLPDPDPRLPGAPAVPPTPLAPAVACARAKLCDGFEAYPAGGPPGAPWTTSTQGTGTVVVDEGRAFAGKRSVLVKVAAAGPLSRAMIAVAKPALPVAGNDLHGRAMFYVDRTPPYADNRRYWWVNVAADGPLPGGAGAGRYAFGGVRELLEANYEPDHCFKHPARTYPTGRWACVQWHFDGPHDALRVWVDGTYVDDMAVAGFAWEKCSDGRPSQAGTHAWRAPSFERLSLGWMDNHQARSTPVAMWIDEVAIDSRPIACPETRR